MKDHELDGILSKKDDLVPSSGFVGNVMDAVRREASAPPPIPFPWKRALPGLVLCVLSLVAVWVRALLQPGPPRAAEAPSPSILMTILMKTISDIGGLLSAANVGGLGWIVLALLLTLASVMLSLRFIGRRL